MIEAFTATDFNKVFLGTSNVSGLKVDVAGRHRQDYDFIFLMKVM